MGLDVDLVKFDKAHFDAHCDAERNMCYWDGVHVEVQLAYYRKHHEVLELIVQYCGRNQTTYGELTRRTLKKIRRRAIREKWGWPEEMKALVKDLNRILHRVDFNTETVALCWVS